MTPFDLALPDCSLSRLTGSEVHSTLAKVEREHILSVYRQTDGNKTQAADLLGINRLTLRRELKDFGFE